MIVRILTDRPDQYAFLERIYRGRAEIHYTAATELITAGSAAEEDILIADPELSEKKHFTGILMKRKTAAGKPFIISEPDRVKGLIRELKAAGLEAAGELISGEPGMGDMDSGRVETPVQMVQKPFFRCVIGISDLTEGSGAAFLTMLLAEELASESLRDGSLVTVFAPDNDYFYYALGLGKKYGQAGFKKAEDLLEEIRFREDSERITVNVNEGISWIVGAGGTNAEEGAPDRLKEWSLADRIAGDYFLCCYGIHLPETGTETEQPAFAPDVLVVTADPLPSSLLEGRRKLESLRSLNIPLIFAVTQMTDAVKKDLILDYLEADDIVFIPAIDPAAVCEAEYRGENPYRMDLIRKAAMGPICGIIERIKKHCGVA